MVLVGTAPPGSFVMEAGLSPMFLSGLVMAGVVQPACHVNCALEEAVIRRIYDHAGVGASCLVAGSFNLNFSEVC